MHAPTKKKFAFIGAGSLEFTRDLARDILTFEAFRDAHICLMDIDEKRLDYSLQGVQAIIRAGGYPASVSATACREEALAGADGVLITILQGGVDVWRSDTEIPEKYGVDIVVGDTRGPSGIFRFLRTAPVMLEICRDIERLCPNAVVLNYTNPMAMLCRHLQELTSLNITGLCHSVQGTAELLAGFIGAKTEDITYTCAGINHQAFYLDFRWKGQDAMPMLRESMNRPEVANAEPVRNEMFKQLGYYCTESSGHNSEYLPWFRKRPDLIEKYCLHGTEWNPGEHAFILKEYLRRKDSWEGEFKQWLADPHKDIGRGGEYASNIFNAIFGDHEMFTFNGNLRNRGFIDNLPWGACVEVPVLASRNGIQPMHVGSLPDHLAILVNTSSRCEELAVKGCIAGDREMIYQAVCFDPLTSAVLSLEEIRHMVDEMFRQNSKYLGYFQGGAV
ncbi:MAG: alpha-galactosidase [Clostridia bacterium]|nr:alpha-galactosidase [Clostridia bacterium]